MELVLVGIVNYIGGLSATYPVLVGILAIAYMVGLGIKVIREAAKAFVTGTPDKSDDLKLEALEQNKVVKAIYFIADLLIRFKK